MHQRHPGAGSPHRRSGLWCLRRRVRRYQHRGAQGLWAEALDRPGAPAHCEATTRLEPPALPFVPYRFAPWSGGRWSQHRVSAGTETNHVTPTQAIHGVQEVRTIAIETIRHQILEGKATFAPDSAHHLGGQLGLGVKGNLVGHLALLPSLRIGVSQTTVSGMKSRLSTSA